MALPEIKGPRQAISFVSVDETALPKGRLKLRRWLQEIASLHGAVVVSLSYAFGSSEWMAKLNFEHLGHEGDTDILTFDYTLPPVESKKSAKAPNLAQQPYRIHGECCICPSRVMAQSRDWGTRPEEEMQRVMVHGLLHLLGQNDQTTAQRKLMREAEDKALAIFALL